MAKYRVLETSFIDNKLVHPGDEIDYDGEASGNLELIEEPAPTAQPKAGKASKAQPASEDPLV